MNTPAHPTPKSRDALLADISARARRYLDHLAERPVAPSAAAVRGLDAFGGPLPPHGTDPAEVIAVLDDVGSPATVATAGPRYFGFVNGGTLPVALAASWLASVWDQNAALTAMSPIASRLDDIALRWVVEALGLPEGAGGAFVSGATMANATALAAARDATLSRVGWDAHREGLVGAPPVTVWVGADAHTTVSKALGIVGLGRGRALVLSSDRQGRIVPERLPDLSGPTIVCLQAGNVNSGARPVRPPDRVGPRRRRVGARGRRVRALGGASPSHRGQIAGVEQADSWATDAHKWLNVGYDSGIVLVRDAEHLRAAMRTDAPYLVAGPGREPMHHSPQSSQRARGVEVWSVLASLGGSGLAAMIDRGCELAHRLAEGLATTGYTVLNEVVLNQVVVDLGPHTDRIVAAVQAEGTCWAGPTTWQGRRAMRLSVSCWATSPEDVDRSLAAIIGAARAIETAHDERG
jgi:glutamate/tyrosine decarboxylase-like PLP-dependent enzyme